LPAPPEKEADAMHSFDVEAGLGEPRPLGDLARRLGEAAHARLALPAARSGMRRLEGERANEVHAVAGAEREEGMERLHAHPVNGVDEAEPHGDRGADVDAGAVLGPD